MCHHHGAMTASPFEPLKRWAAWMDVLGLAESTKQQYRRNVVNFLVALGVVGTLATAFSGR